MEQSNTVGTHSKVEAIDSMVVVTTKFDKVRVQYLDMYWCINGFALSMIENVVSENHCGVVKDANGVGILMRSMVMAKFKRSLRCMWRLSSCEVVEE